MLRHRFPVNFDDGSTRHIDFLFSDASKNIYQVTHQIAIDHSSINGHTSRFDVTLLINGLPLVQIELKRAGVELLKHSISSAMPKQPMAVVQAYSTIFSFCDQQS